MKKRLKRVVVAMLCMVTMLTSSMSVSAANQKYTYSVDKPGYGTVVISSGTLNVRSGPSTSGTTVKASLPNGSYVMLIGQSSNFYYVQYDTNGNVGYVSKDYINDQSTAYCLNVTTDGGTLNFRSGASTSSSSICALQNGTRLAHKGVSGDWYAGVYGNKTGYVSKQYVWTVSR